MHDLAIIVVSTNEARWLEPCLRTVYEHAGDISLDVVVADNESTDGTAELVASRFPQARVVRCPNRGFAHGNNRALMTTDARFVLFLNPDTEVVEGTFEGLLRRLEREPEIGLAGVRQVDADDNLWPSARRFPTALRALCEALGSEQWPLRPAWAGERELDLRLYDDEFDCDWTSGSYMLARREALESAGVLDERFFIYSEETDLCLRIKNAGWRIRHLPQMTIVHHAGKAGPSPRMESQSAYARRQYAAKHFTRGYAAAYLAAVGARYLVRLLVYRRRGDRRRLEASQQALATLLGRRPPPFGAPPPVALQSSGERH